MLWQNGSRPNVIWRDESGTKLKQKEHTLSTKVPVPSALLDNDNEVTCYTGESRTKLCETYYVANVFEQSQN